jgi:hypothetical protein
MQRNAQVRARLNHLPVACGAGNVSQALPICDVRFEYIAEFRASQVKRLVNPWCATVDDNQIGTVSREKTIQDPLGKVVASPMSVACD